jgi:hypothetical protein
MEHHPQQKTPESGAAEDTAPLAFMGMLLVLGGVVRTISALSAFVFDGAGIRSLGWTIVSLVVIVAGFRILNYSEKKRELAVAAYKKPQAFPVSRAEPQEQLPDITIPNGLATDLQLPWLQDIHRQLQGMKTPEATAMRAEVEERMEAVRLAAIQRDLDAVAHIQDEGLRALRAQRAELGLEDKGEEQA